MVCAPWAGWLRVNVIEYVGSGHHLQLLARRSGYTVAETIRRVILRCVSPNGDVVAPGVVSALNGTLARGLSSASETERSGCRECLTHMLLVCALSDNTFVSDVLSQVWSVDPGLARAFYVAAFERGSVGVMRRFLERHRLSPLYPQVVASGDVAALESVASVAEIAAALGARGPRMAMQRLNVPLALRLLLEPATGVNRERDAGGSYRDYVYGRSVLTALVTSVAALKSRPDGSRAWPAGVRGPLPSQPRVGEFQGCPSEEEVWPLFEAAWRDEMLRVFPRNWLPGWSRVACGEVMEWYARWAFRRGEPMHPLGLAEMNAYFLFKGECGSVRAPVEASTLRDVVAGLRHVPDASLAHLAGMGVLIGDRIVDVELDLPRSGVSHSVGRLALTGHITVDTADALRLANGCRPRVPGDRAEAVARILYGMGLRRRLRVQAIEFMFANLVRRRDGSRAVAPGLDDDTHLDAARIEAADVDWATVYRLLAACKKSVLGSVNPRSVPSAFAWSRLLACRMALAGGGRAAIVEGMVDAFEAAVEDPEERKRLVRSYRLRSKDRLASPRAIYDKFISPAHRRGPLAWPPALL